MMVSLFYHYILRKISLERGIRIYGKTGKTIRRRALELYLGGVNAKDIFRATGLSHTAVMRLWNRCCAKDPETGEYLGFRALVPKSKIKKFIR